MGCGASTDQRKPAIPESPSEFKISLVGSESIEADHDLVFLPRKKPTRFVHCLHPLFEQLQTATEIGDFDKLKELVEELELTYDQDKEAVLGVLNGFTQYGTTLLQIAAKEGFVKIFFYLADKEVSVLETRNGSLPLHSVLNANAALSAAYHYRSENRDRPELLKHLQVDGGAAGRLKILEYLVKHPDTDINSVDSQGYTALMHAVRNKFRNGVIFLLEQPTIDLDLGCDTQETALIIAADTDQTEMVELLCRAGAAVDIQCARKTTALHSATKWKNEKAMMCLLQHNANPNLRNGKNRSSLGIAAQSGFASTIQALITYGGDLHEPQGTTGETALELALRRKSVDVGVEITDSDEEEEKKPHEHTIVETSSTSSLATTLSVRSAISSPDMKNNQGRNAGFDAEEEFSSDTNADANDTSYKSNGSSLIRTPTIGEADSKSPEGLVRAKSSRRTFKRASLDTSNKNSALYCFEDKITKNEDSRWVSESTETV